jgi:hypothetical protein
MAEVELYNLRIVGTPVHLISQSEEMRCYYPEQFSIKLSVRESVIEIVDNLIYCSCWEEEGVALRGRFLFNPDGICVAQEVQADSVGRNVNEFLRQVEAWQYATKTGEVCPAGWRPGKKTLPVNTDAEKMAGHVGDYITIEEIMS